MKKKEFFDLKNEFEEAIKLDLLSDLLKKKERAFLFIIFDKLSSN